MERAAEEGVHVIYTDGYDHLHKELDSVSKNMLLDRGVESEISAVLAQIGKVVSNRNYFDSCREYMAGQMDRREALEAEAAERGVAVPALGHYDTWRNLTDFAVGRCEELMDDPGNYGTHLDYIAHAQESLGSSPTFLSLPSIMSSAMAAVSAAVPFSEAVIAYITAFALASSAMMRASTAAVTSSAAAAASEAALASM